MPFNSIDFALFLPVVFILYWFVAHKNLQLQNFLILGASYFFYGCWNWRFLPLIIFSTLAGYLAGLGFARIENTIQRKLILWTNIIVNLGFLGFFKYYDFFIENFVSVFSFLGKEISLHPLRIILPVGISFYTFQNLSYAIDVYNKKINPTKDLLAFSSFISFFPQLVAGPIERATNLLPQFYGKRTFTYAKAADGLRQILWGLVKKVVIADNCAEFVNIIFDNSDVYSGSTLALGAVLFSFQIYGDFSGYSDIAIGASRLFGFDLMRNFNYPYFSRDIAEFWRRWHISLTTWFRDYLYIPLGGSRGGTWMKIRNTFIIFLVSGFWHGANWTFILWSAINAIYFLPLLLMKRNRKHLEVVAKGKLFPSPKELLSMGVTFGLTVFGWIFFRAENVGHAASFISNMFSMSLFALPSVLPKTVLLLVALFTVVEWLGREQRYAIEQISVTSPLAVRWVMYFFITGIIFYFTGIEQQFIYFQF